MLVITSIAADSQNCFWAKRAGGTNSENGRDITTDLNGNVYVIGDFEGSTITLGSTTLTSTNPGTQQYFIVKYDAGGVIQWAKGVTGIATCNGITTDNAGNIYVTGNFDGASTVFGTTTLTNLGGGDIFIVKYDPSGNVIWAKSAGGSSNSEWGESIAYDGINGLYVTGQFYSSSIAIGSTTLTNHASSGPDFFIAKYDLISGNAIWAKSAGGNRYDMGYGVTVDGAGSIYVAGSFKSDSIKFDATPTLVSLTPGASNVFIVKYDSIGNTIWSKQADGLWGDVFAYDIKSDAANNIFIVGEFQGVNAQFGSDTLVNHSAGSSDVFIAKYNSNGNVLWARGAGGTNYDYSKKLDVDGIGNVYTVGFYKSASMFFDGDTLINSSLTCNSYVMKYDNNGVFQWTKKIGTTGSSDAFARGIAAGPGDNVYFTGSFISPYLSFGSTTLTNAGYDDFFVADIFHFSSGVSSFSNVSCFGASDGGAVTTFSGGNSPVTYLWSTTPAQTSPNAINLSAGIYSVVVTEGYGCAQTATVNISEPFPDAANICMVTVDSLSQNNVIIWDKTSFVNVDSFTVYREISTNNYQPLATIPFDSLSQYTDTVRTKYFPNTGNPNSGTFRYKIQAVSTCGSSGPISPYHNTIYLLNSGGTFYWTQLYTIEGGINPVTSYVLMRDNFSNGNWTAVSSVSGTQQTIADPLYTVYQTTASWRVETQWGITCSATRNASSSISNKFSNLVTKVDENSFDEGLSVFPNPSNGVFTIQDKTNSKDKKAIIEVYNILGEEVHSVVVDFKNETILNLIGQSKGVYFLKVKTGKQVLTRRVVIE